MATGSRKEREVRERRGQGEERKDSLSYSTENEQLSTLGMIVGLSEKKKRKKRKRRKIRKKDKIGIIANNN